MARFLIQPVERERDIPSVHITAEADDYDSAKQAAWKLLNHFLCPIRIVDHDGDGDSVLRLDLVET